MFIPGPYYALDDDFLRERLQNIISANGLTTVVETGVNDGQSTLAFTRMVANVISIDNDPECIDCARERLSTAGVTNGELLLGNSPDVLRSVMGRIDPEKTLFFLDAHWGGECPTVDEIRAIPHGKGILVFHDFFVPGRSNEFGWDHVLINGVYQVLGYDFLKPELDTWSPTHRIEYPTQVMGSKRGSAYVFPQ